MRSSFTTAKIKLHVLQVPTVVTNLQVIIQTCTQKLVTITFLKINFSFNLVDS